MTFIKPLKICHRAKSPKPFYAAYMTAVAQRRSSLAAKAGVVDAKPMPPQNARLLALNCVPRSVNTCSMLARQPNFSDAAAPYEWRCEGYAFRAGIQ